MAEGFGMNRKTVIKLIIALLLVCAGAYFYAYVKKDAALYDTAYARSQMTPELKIYAGHDFEYEFECDRDNITGVKLLLSRAGGKDGKIQYTLEECGQGGAVSSGSLKLSRFKSGKFTFLDTDTFKNSAGKRYRLVIACSNSEESAAVAAVTPDGTGTPALCFTYIEWDLQTMIIFCFLAAYLVVFVVVLVKIFRK